MKNFRLERPGCLVLDLAMPGMSGLDLQGWLRRLGVHLPVIFLTGRGDVPSSVRAMKAGAVDFLMKPIHDGELLKAIEVALRREREARAARTEAAAVQARLATLTPRERQVLEHVVSGQLNKQIAADLGIVEKTIKVHRGRVMKKMGVKSLAELARLAERSGIGRRQLL
jgi:FixJ family two-component response regulator